MLGLQTGMYCKILQAHWASCGSTPSFLSHCLTPFDMETSTWIAIHFLAAGFPPSWLGSKFQTHLRQGRVTNYSFPSDSSNCTIFRVEKDFYPLVRQGGCTPSQPFSRIASILLGSLQACSWQYWKEKMKLHFWLFEGLNRWGQTPPKPCGLLIQQVHRSLAFQLLAPHRDKPPNLHSAFIQQDSHHWY